jgi:hypothetical protein
MRKVRLIPAIALRNRLIPFIVFKNPSMDHSPLYFDPAYDKKGERDIHIQSPSPFSGFTSEVYTVSPNRISMPLLRAALYLSYF